MPAPRDIDGVEPCDRNGVGHGDMVAPDVGTIFRGACRVMCEALTADEGSILRECGMKTRMS